MKDNIYYIIKLKDDFRMSDTIIKKKFCGRILLTNYDGTTVFELNGSTAIVVVQLENIEWMAPSKILWNKKEGDF